MSKKRYIDTKFWSDSWVSNLKPEEKFLFLYFLTNEKSNIAGIYELPVKIMAVETGLKEEEIQPILKKFEKDGKVIYLDGWVGIKNFIKHQDIQNEKILKGINLILQHIPTNILDKLSIAHVYPLNNINININNNGNQDSLSSKKELHSEVKVLFSFYKQKYNEWISKETPIFNWGACEKLAKPHLKTLGLDKMKRLLLFYLKYASEEDRKFWKTNAYSLQVFLAANTLNILNVKYGRK